MNEQHRMITDDVKGLVARLAASPRASASPGEGRAAEAIGAALMNAGGRTRYEEEYVYGNYWRPHGLLMALTLAASRLRRRASTVLGVVALVAVIQDLGGQRRWFRRLVMRQRPTINVVSEFGPDDAAAVVIVSAHHDAARTGMAFSPAAGRAASRLWRRIGGSTPPVMWPFALAPALVTAGAVLRRSFLTRRGARLAAITAASLVDIARRDAVPGANDNLSGVAVLVALARALGEEPPTKTRVVLLSTGAEETGLEGMWAYGRRHFADLDRARTAVICVDTVGSPNLVLARREGPLATKPYSEMLQAVLADEARRLNVPLGRPVVFRGATDGSVALRAGLDAALLGSVDDAGHPANYHWPTDTPDRLDYSSVENAARLCLATIHRLDT